MRLQQLMGKTRNSGGPVQKPSRGKKEEQKTDGTAGARPNGEASAVPDLEGVESRRVQVKSAVRFSEKKAFEALALRRQVTLSDIIRDFLLQEAKREQLL